MAISDERIPATIKGSYRPLIEKILKHRPHLRNRAGVIERALDFYLDSIVKTDNLKRDEVDEDVSD